MKRSAFILLCFFALQPLHAQKPIEGDSWKLTNQFGKGSLSVIYYECPRLIEDVNGEMKGVCVDILKDFAAYVKTKYNKTIEIKYISREAEFGQFLKKVKASNNVIGISNTTITDERKSEMKFSPYYLKTPLVVLTHKDAPNFKTLKELIQSGLSGQVEKETAYASYMQKIKGEGNAPLTINYLPTTHAVLEQLSKSNKYFSVMDFTEYLGETKNNPNIKRQTISLGYADQLGFIMSKKSDWDALFSEFLTDGYRDSASYKKSVTSNLGSNFMAMIK
jgi:ABC-type amino acid transport substrate-binding protein